MLISKVQNKFQCLLKEMLDMRFSAGRRADFSVIFGDSIKEALRWRSLLAICLLAGSVGGNLVLADSGNRDAAGGIDRGDARVKEDIMLYDPTCLTQVALSSGGTYKADLPVSAVVMGKGKKKFLIGKEWYGIGDIVLGQWVVDEIATNRLVFRSQHDHGKLWTIKLNAGDGLTVKSYR